MRSTDQRGNLRCMLSAPATEDVKRRTSRIYRRAAVRRSNRKWKIEETFGRKPEKFLTDAGNELLPRAEAILKQVAEASMALRGPAFSSHLPKMAADNPRTTIAILKIQPIVVSSQSCPLTCVLTPISCDSGSLNTLKA